MGNFGEIYNGFNDIMVESFIKKDIGKKKAYNTYISLVKENKVLKTQFKVYDLISNKCIENDLTATEFIKESVSLMDGFTKKEINEANNKLFNILKENGYDGSDYDLKELHSNIHNLIILNKNKKASDIDKLVESFSYVLTYIKNNKQEEKITVNESVARLAVNKFNDKYGSLDPDTYSVIKSLIEDNGCDGKTVFDSIVSECLSIVKGKINGCEGDTKDKLIMVESKLLSMEYSQDTFIKDIIRCNELRKTLK